MNDAFPVSRSGLGFYPIGLQLGTIFVQHGAIRALRLCPKQGAAMAKKRATTTTRFTPGAAIRVRAGVPAPDMEDVAVGGWTGTVSELVGSGPSPSYLIEWDASTLAGMPPEYLARCEAQSLYHKMMCLAEDALEPANG